MRDCYAGFDGRWTGTDRCMGRKVEQSKWKKKKSSGWTWEQRRKVSVRVANGTASWSSTRLTALREIRADESGEEDTPHTNTDNSPYPDA